MRAHTTVIIPLWCTNTSVDHYRISLCRLKSWKVHSEYSYIDCVLWPAALETKYSNTLRRRWLPLPPPPIVTNNIQTLLKSPCFPPSPHHYYYLLSLQTLLPSATFFFFFSSVHVIKQPVRQTYRLGVEHLGIEPSAIQLGVKHPKPLHYSALYSSPKHLLCTPSTHLTEDLLFSDLADAFI